MAEDKKDEKETKKKSKKKSKKKPEPEISASVFAGRVGMHPRRSDHLVKKFGDEERTERQWKKLCKDEGVSY